MYDFADKGFILSLTPSFATFAGMVLFLTFSFWVYRRKKHRGRELQREYEILHLSAKRPRVGALTCFTHSGTLNDMMHSLSGSDITRILRHYNLTRSHHIQRLESIPEKLRPKVRNHLSSHPKTYGQSPGQSKVQEETSSISRYLYYDELGIIPDEEYEHNAYYEDSCVHPTSYKKSKKRRKQDKENKTKIKMSISADKDEYTSTDPSKHDKELTNRISPEVVGSPRTLHGHEELHWENETTKAEKSKRKRRNTLVLHRTDSRSLSHHYEYENLVEEDIQRIQKTSLDMKNEISRDRSRTPSPINGKKGTHTNRGKRQKNKRNKKSKGSKSGVKIFWLNTEDIHQSAI